MYHMYSNGDGYNPISSNNKELIDIVLKKLENVEKRLPNGELKEMRNSLEALVKSDLKITQELGDLRSQVGDLKFKLSDMNRRLLDPESGVIVKVNNTSEKVGVIELDKEKFGKDYPILKNRIYIIEQWQNNMNKAMWAIFSSIIGLIVTMVFQFFLNK